MSRLRISEALIFLFYSLLIRVPPARTLLGACVPTTVAVAPQSWVMDIPAPLGLSLCVSVWCWLVGRVGACLCGCYGAMCVWVDWRLVVLVCGASWRDGAMRVPLAHTLLGVCVPTTGTAVPQSWVMDISAPLGLSLCVSVWCWLVGRGGACLCGCYGAMCVGGVAVGGSCLWCELVRWCYTRTSGTHSAWGVVPTTVAVAPQSWVMDISAPPGLSLCDASLVLVGRSWRCMPVWLLWCDVRGRSGGWRFMFVERVGEMGLCAYLWHALCLGFVCPRPELSFLSRGLWIYQPLWGCRCVCQSGSKGRYRLVEIEVFGISFVLLLLQN